MEDEKDIYDLAADGDIEKLMILLSSNPDLARFQNPSLGRVTPLHFAWDPPVVELLVHFGAEIDARDDSGKTPLHSAAWHENLEVVESLLRHGADPRAMDKEGNSVMYQVSRKSDTESRKAIAEMLRERGVPLDLSSALNFGMADVARKMLTEEPDAITAAPHPFFLVYLVVGLIYSDYMEEAIHPDEPDDHEKIIADRIIDKHIDLLDKPLLDANPTEKPIQFALDLAKELPRPTVTERLLAALRGE